MEHTQIVTAAELENYADTKDSEAVIPELIWMLVNQSVPDLALCRIPYGDVIGQPGWDGRVETVNGYRQFVPPQNSFWEIGTGSRPQNKATDDFGKRTRQMSAAERNLASYVFVTPYSGGSGGFSEPKQRKWVRRRSRFGWKNIKINDGVIIADWLREFPAIGRWLLKRMKLTKSISGFSTPSEHWEDIQQLARAAGDPPLPPNLFLVGRDQACLELERLFKGEINQVVFVAESQLDTEDFVAAFLAIKSQEVQRAYSNRCLFVHEQEAWLSMVALRTSHVLVAHPKLDLESSGESLHLAAGRKGHGVVIPACGALAGENSKLIKLRSPSASVLEKTLTDANYTAARARELANAGTLSLAALKRKLRGLSELPPYASWESARLLAQAGLLGSWAGENLSDRTALEKLLGKSYGEWIEMIRPETLRADTPLTQRNENWKIISRGEAWTALGPRLTNDDLDRFQNAALTVLGENDPKLELPADERLMAGFHGKVLQHSYLLRKGIAETLALLGSKPKALSSCSLGRPELVALLAVRELLKNADWVKWASLGNVLPLLAEAAPDEFLDAVETALIDSDKSPFKVIFSKEESGIMGWNHMSGLLWALETLAWHPDYLVRVTILLGELAAIDPGGNWANRPANSLATIFLPWFPQTCADIPKRKSAVEALLREQPAVGWKLLLSLLPTMHSSSMGSHKPVWRDLIPSTWSEGVTGQDYGQQVVAYADLAVGTAAADLPKLAELIERLPNLPNPAHSRVLEHLSTDAVLGLSESDRLPLWEALVDLASKHRFFADAQWAMGAEIVAKIDAVAKKLSPTSPNLFHRRLFSDRDFDLFDDKHGEVDYAEQERKLGLRRQTAVREILDQYQMTGVLDFTRQVASPEKVGLALGCIATESVDAVLFPQYLGTEEKPLAAFVAGFVWGRLGTKNWPWVDALPINSWTVEQKTAFLILLPFVQEAWQRATQLLGADEGSYWRKANVNPWGANESLLQAVQKLLDYGRPRPVIGCFARLIFSKISFPPELAVRALLENLTANESFRTLDQHDTVELIKWLQENPKTDSNALFQIEWNYLRLLDRYSGGSAKTLEKRLATDPAFFCEVIRIIFRSDKAESKDVEPTEQQRNIATNAYHLLHNWQTVPGVANDNSFDAPAFWNWLKEVKKSSAESGHLRIALNQVGQVLPHAPKDADGIWINPVAEALNAKDAGEMRSGFTTKLMNLRGVHGFSAGEEERKIVSGFRKTAEALEKRSHSRFATAMRELAEYYERDAEREAQRNPYGE
jgi:hypothetical protein